MSGELVAAAVDLGAGSGRVVVGRIGAGGSPTLELTETQRFDTPVRSVGGVLRWDLEAIWAAVGVGVRAAVVEHGARSIGIDSWAVDYGLLDAGGRMVADPACYRDDRTNGALDRIGARLDRSEHYRITGIAYQPFNTVYQLMAEPDGLLDRDVRLLMLPDLLVQRLTGSVAAERTNASTTGLYDVRAGTWSNEIVDRLGLPAGLLPRVVDPGTVAGPVLPAVLREWSIPAGTEVDVVRVASHDTASAVAAVPAEDERFGFVSCGTWSLVGLELDHPVTTDAARAANFTNEVGIDGTIRLLRNVTGLWLLTECLREWGGERPADRDALLAEAAELPARRWSVDATSTQFLAPGGMPGRIRAAAGTRGREPRSRAEIVRCILDSLAVAHADAVEDAVRLSGHPVEVVHVVGGGSANVLLAQATADACALPVVAGPAEATAIGNLLVQARARGVLGSGAAGRAAARRLVAATSELRRYEPG